MIKLLRAFVHSNVFVAVVLLVLTWSTYSAVPNLVPRWHVLAGIFLGSFALYTFHRLYKVDFIPTEQLGGRHTWAIKHGNLMKVAMAVAVLAGMVVLPHFSAAPIVWLAPAFIVSMGYTVPFIPTEARWWRLRDIPFMKPFIIAFVVAYLTYAFPVFEQWGIGEVFQPVVVCGFVERFLFLVAVTIPFEIRDTLADRDAGLETLATAFGLKKARTLCLMVAGAWLLALAVIWLPAGLWAQFAAFAALWAVVVIAIVCLSESWDELSYTLVFEGLIVVYATMWFLVNG